MSDRKKQDEMVGTTGPARRGWMSPRLEVLPRLSELTLQSTGGEPIPGGGGTGGGGSTVIP